MKVTNLVFTMLDLAKKLSYTPGEVLGDYHLLYPIVVENRQQGVKPVRQPHVYFIRKTIDSRSLVRSVFSACRISSSIKRLLHPAALVGKIGVGLNKIQSGFLLKSF